MTIYLITRKWTDVDNYPQQTVDTTYGYFLTKEAVEAEVERLGDEFFWEEVEPGNVAPPLTPLPLDPEPYVLCHFAPREGYSQNLEDYA